MCSSEARGGASTSDGAAAAPTGGRYRHAYTGAAGPAPDTRASLLMSGPERHRGGERRAGVLNGVRSSAHDLRLDVEAGEQTTVKSGTWFVEFQRQPRRAARHRLCAHK